MFLLSCTTLLIAFLATLFNGSNCWISFITCFATKSFIVSGFLENSIICCFISGSIIGVLVSSDHSLCLSFTKVINFLTTNNSFSVF